MGGALGGASLPHTRTRGGSAGLPTPRIVCAARTTGGTSVWPPSGPSEAEKLQEGARTPNTRGGHPSPRQAGE